MRVLVIDDDEALGDMLREYLTSDGFTVDVVRTAEEGHRRALSGEFDAILLDIMLPDASGIQVLSKIRQQSKIPIIVLTARGDDVDRVVGLEMGADDYIAKPFYSRELTARLRAVLRRVEQDKPLAAPATVLGQLELRPAQRRLSWAGDPLNLTLSEFNLVEVLLNAQGDVVGKDELSKAALGKTRAAYDRSIDVHIGHIRQKLAAASDGRLEIRTVRGVGYALLLAS